MLTYYLEWGIHTLLLLQSGIHRLLMLRGWIACSQYLGETRWLEGYLNGKHGWMIHGWWPGTTLCLVLPVTSQGIMQRNRSVDLKGAIAFHSGPFHQHSSSHGKSHVVSFVEGIQRILTCRDITELDCYSLSNIKMTYKNKLHWKDEWGAPWIPKNKHFEVQMIMISLNDYIIRHQHRCILAFYKQHYW